MSGFGWTRLIAAAARQGLAPQLVWELTPRELLACLAADEGDALQRRELQALLAQFPDGPANTETEARETGARETMTDKGPPHV
ncbi:MAG: phage tail assembly chaperone [Hyphomicrobiales bacterium]|nr:phage tail assembly chaperone [Hyphomicrobiales bacterium]